MHDDHGGDNQLVHFQIMIEKAGSGGHRWPRVPTAFTIPPVVTLKLTRVDESR